MTADWDPISEVEAVRIEATQRANAPRAASRSMTREDWVEYYNALAKELAPDGLPEGWPDDWAQAYADRMVRGVDWCGTGLVEDDPGLLG